MLSALICVHPRPGVLAALLFAGAVFAQRAPVEDAWDFLAKGDRPHAVTRLKQILQANPSDADAHLLLGSILMVDGNRSASIAHLEQAVRLRPRSAEALNALGEAYNNFGESKSARAVFEQAVADDPRFAQARVNLGLALLQANELDDAAKQLDAAISLLGRVPDAAYPRYLRAKVYTAESEVENAAACLKEAVSIRPDFGEAWSDLGQARKMLLDDAGALAAFQHAVEASPDDAVAQYRLGSEYLHHDQTDKAIEHLEKAFRLNPEDQSTLYNLQIALRQAWRGAEADAVKKQLAELFRRRDQQRQNALRAVQINNEGAAREKSGDLRAAVEKYRAAVQLNPQHAGMRINFAAALLRLGQWNDGIAELREALRIDPENAATRKALDDAIAHAPRGSGPARPD